MPAKHSKAKAPSIHVASETESESSIDFDGGGRDVLEKQKRSSRYTHEDLGKSSLNLLGYASEKFLEPLLLDSNLKEELDKMENYPKNVMPIRNSS